MSHLEEGILHELLDGEIPSSDLAPIQAHLTSCPECRARLEEARGFSTFSDELLEGLDEPEIVTVSKPSTPLPAWRRPAWQRNLAWAASIVIAVFAGSQIPARTATINEQKSVLAPRDSTTSAAAPLQEAARTESQQIPRENRPAAPVPAPERARQEFRRDSGAAETREAAGAATEAVIAGSRDSLARREMATNALRPRDAAAAPPAAAAVGQSSRRLDEITSSSGALGAGLADRAMMAKASATPDTISLTQAMTRLGGTIRLIEGRVPLRLEALGNDVRVIYNTAVGELVLVEQLAAGRVTYRIVAPQGFAADSVEYLRARVR